MSDPLWLPEILRAAGLTVREVEGWRTRGHGDFGAIWGVIAHHTGSNPPSDSPNYIAFHPELGLASQLHLNRQGVWTICGVGIASHAGYGDYPGIQRNNANAVTIGIEAENNGTEGWSPIQRGSYVRGIAAILRHLGLPSARVIGHKEWAGASQGKWDPGGIDMRQFRTDVAAVMNSLGGPSVTVWDEQFTNFKGMPVSYGTAIRYIDELVNESWDQVYRGWDQLGHNEKGEPLTLVDNQAAKDARLTKIEEALARIEDKMDALIGQTSA